MTEQHSVHAAHLASESAEAARGLLEEVVHHPVEVVTAISLSVAALLTHAGQLEAIDIFGFSQWLNAYATDNTKLEAFYRERFRPEFAPAFKDWIATKCRCSACRASASR